MSNQPKNNLIREMLEEELDRNRRAQEAYRVEHARLPKGSISIKRRGEKAYCYLKHREGSKVMTDYVGTAGAVEESLRQQVARRIQLEQTIRQLEEEQRYIEKALAL